MNELHPCVLVCAAWIVSLHSLAMAMPSALIKFFRRLISVSLIPAGWCCSEAYAIWPRHQPMSYRCPSGRQNRAAPSPRVHERMRMCMHACMRACMHGCTVRACDYACTRRYSVYACLRLYVCMRTCVRVCGAWSSITSASAIAQTPRSPSK